MKASVRYGAIAIFSIIAVFIVLTSFNFVYGSDYRDDSNWTDIVVSNYPINDTNNSADWVDFNWTINGSMHFCFVEVGSNVGKHNLTGTVSTSGVAVNDSCYLNITTFGSKSNDTTANKWFNVTLRAYNDTHEHGFFASNIIDFRVDSITGSATTIGLTKENETFDIANYIDPNMDTRQDYVNYTFLYTDNTSYNSNCKVEILHEQILNKSKSGPYVNTYSYSNYTSYIVDSTATPVGTETRRYEAFIPASYITDGIYQGKFWVKPYCTDASGNEGTTSDMKWAVVNPLPANTWVPLGVLLNDTTLAGWINDNSAYKGNISYISHYQYDNASFITHQYDTVLHATDLINYTNESAIYVLSTNGYKLIRMNDTKLDAVSNIHVYYDDTPQVARGSWSTFGNLRANTTKYIINSSTSCGSAFTWLAWFNATDDRCLGGCWETYFNGFGFNNETEIPFGTNVWLLTNTSNITISEYPSPNQVGGTCYAT